MCSRVKRLRPAAAAQVRDLESSLDRGWLLLTLRDLESVQTQVEINRFKTRSQVRDERALLVEWQRIGHSIEDKRRQGVAGPSRSAALRAIVQAP